MNKRIEYKLYGGRSILLCVLLVVFIAFGAVMAGVAYKSCPADGVVCAQTVEGIETASETQTMYYLNIPIKGVTGNVDVFPKGNDYRYYAIKERLDEFTKSQEKVQFVLTFNYIQVNGCPLICTWKIPVSFVTSGKDIFYDTMNDMAVKAMPRLTFNEDIKINIRKEYYKYFAEVFGSSGGVSQSSSVSVSKLDKYKFSITFMFNGNGYIVYNGEKMCDYPEKYSDLLRFGVSGITTTQEEKPDDYDPIEDEGQIPDNGGVGDRPIEVIKPVENNGGWHWLVCFIIFVVSCLVFIVLFPMIVDIIAGVFL